MRSNFLRFIVLSVACLHIAGVLYGQSGRGGISGTVYNTDGSPVPYAHVSLKDTTLKTLSDVGGRFDFKNVIPGNYILIVSSLGYEPEEMPVEVVSGRNVHTDIFCRYNLTQLQEIVISATKRDELIEKVPVSATSVSSKDIENSHMQTTTDLTSVAPNFSFINAGSKTHSMITIRGINAFSTEPSVALYVDGVNQFDFTSLNTALFDIEKVEILRGPQSTLFGRNAMGGVINIVTKKPGNIPHGFVKTETGNYGHRLYQLGYRGPVVKNKFFAGLSGQYDKRDGYFTNTFTGRRFDAEENITGNACLRYLPGNRLSFNYTSNIQFNDQKGVFPYAANDSIALASPYATNVNRSGGTKRVVWNNALEARYAAGSFDVTSVTSYQFVNRIFTDTLDRDYTPYDLAAFRARSNDSGVPVHVLAEELRFSSVKDTRFQWMAGTYLFLLDKEENYDQLTGRDAALIAGDTLAPYINTTYSKAHNYGVAFFGQATYDFSAKFKLTAGLRYDYENRNNTIKAGFIKGNAPERIVFPETKKQAIFNAFSPKLALAYSLSPGTGTYISYSRGFRAGGINPYTTNTSYQNYDPEFSDNYEWGLKTRLANDRVSVRATLFLIEWKDQQVNTLIPGQGFQFGVLNAGEVESKGAELEVNARPFKNITLSYAFGYTDARFRQLPLPDLTTGRIVGYEGNRQIATPDVTSRLAALYEYPFQLGKIPVKALLNAEWKYTGAQYFDLINTIRQDPYHLVNLQAGIGTPHLEVRAWVKNLTESQYLSFATPFSAKLSLLGDPRTCGFSLAVKF